MLLLALHTVRCRAPNPELSTRYRTIDTLREYVLIDQEQTHAARFVRQGDDRWMMEETDDPEATLVLSSVEAELALAEVYHKVNLKT